MDIWLTETRDINLINTPSTCMHKVEVNPMWQQKELREFCKHKGIHVTAYSPLGANNTGWGDNRILASDVLQEIALAKGKTVAQVRLPFNTMPYSSVSWIQSMWYGLQVALRWVYEQGVSLVVKSFNKKRMEENLHIFDWFLTQDELQKMSMLPQRKGVLLSQFLGAYKLTLEIDEEV